MSSSVFKSSILVLIIALAILAIPSYSFCNPDEIENDGTDNDVVIDGSDTQILCGDAVNLGDTKKANKLQNNNGIICIVSDRDTDKKESALLKID